MSTLAAVTSFPRSAIDSLRAAATPRKPFLGKPKDIYEATLRKHGREVAVYSHSGAVLATLLVFLEEARNINLMDSGFNELSRFLTEARGSTHFVMDEGNKASLTGLAAEKFSELELRDFFNQFNDTAEPNAGRWMLDGVEFFRESLSQVDGASVGILVIG